MVGPTQTAWITPEPVVRPLREKAGQHKALRKAGYPYVLAIMLEGWRLSAEEVAEAWFGRPQSIVDIDAGEVIEERLDRSGLHYFGQEIRYRSVSGTLVFRAEIDERLNRHRLRAWYIQNPYAKVPIGIDLFPVEASFVVTGQTPTGLLMDWRRQAH